MSHWPSSSRTPQTTLPHRADFKACECGTTSVLPVFWNFRLVLVHEVSSAAISQPGAVRGEEASIYDSGSLRCDSESFWTGGCCPPGRAPAAVLAGSRWESQPWPVLGAQKGPDSLGPGFSFRAPPGPDLHLCPLAASLPRQRIATSGPPKTRESNACTIDHVVGATVGSQLSFRVNPRDLRDALQTFQISGLLRSYSVGSAAMRVELRIVSVTPRQHGLLEPWQKQRAATLTQDLTPDRRRLCCQKTQTHCTKLACPSLIVSSSSSKARRRKPYTIFRCVSMTSCVSQVPSSAQLRPGAVLNQKRVPSS